MKLPIPLLALLLTVACSSSTEPGDKPNWADNTSWKGSVTMQSGSTLDVSFQLTTGLHTDLMTQHEIWGVSVAHARIVNMLTGRVAEQVPDGPADGLHVTPSVRADLALELSMFPDSAFDPTVPSCATAAPPGSVPYYKVNLQIAPEGTLRGTVDVGCFPSGTASDSRPIVLRQI